MPYVRDTQPQGQWYVASFNNYFWRTQSWLRKALWTETKETFCQQYSMIRNPSWFTAEDEHARLHLT